MRLGLVSCAVLLAALPAGGDNTLLTPPVIAALTSIDSEPSKAALVDAFGTPSPEGSLLAIARDHTVDLGIELRAIRALPAFCPPAPQVCGPGTVVHDGLITIIDSYPSSPDVCHPSAPPTPQDLLRLRAAVEALGATHSGLAADVDKLSPFLCNGSRDVRATVVHALRDLCNTAAIEPLRALRLNEPSQQVQLAITAAVQDLARCSP